MTTTTSYLGLGERLPEFPQFSDPSTSSEQLPEFADLIVIGAGIIGLSIAWRAAQTGLKVVVVDRNQAGAGTTMSATGMLAAAAEYEPGGDSLLAFARRSQALWPSFCTELEEASGLGAGYDGSGTLICALSREELARLRARHSLQTSAGLDATWLEGPALRKLEPGLRPSAVAGIFCADDHQVDPRRIIPALRIALRNAGGILIEGMEGVDLRRSGNTVAGIRSVIGECRSTHVVLATGVWTGEEGSVSRHLRIPMRPLKGQALCLRDRQGGPILRHVVWTENVHLAPKKSGRLIVGATVEEAGFDASVTAGGVFALLEGARRALPAVEELELEGVWTGFRPTTDDDAPIIGPSDVEGLILAVGHHRNGVLLAPVTAEAVVDLVVSGEMRPEAVCMSLGRFSE